MNDRAPNYDTVNDLIVIRIDPVLRPVLTDILVDGGFYTLETSEGSILVLSQSQLPEFNALIEGSRLANHPAFNALINPDAPLPSSTTIYTRDAAYSYMLEAYVGVNSHRLNDTHFYNQLTGAYNDYINNHPEQAAQLRLVFEALDADRAVINNNYAAVFDAVNNLTPDSKERGRLSPEVTAQVNAAYAPLLDYIGQRATLLAEATSYSPYIDTIGSSRARQLGFEVRPVVMNHTPSAGEYIRIRIPGAVNSPFTIAIPDGVFNADIIEMAQNGEIQILGEARFNRNPEYEIAISNDNTAYLINALAGNNAALGAIVTVSNYASFRDLPALSLGQQAADNIFIATEIMASDGSTLFVQNYATYQQGNTIINIRADYFDSNGHLTRAGAEVVYSQLRSSFSETQMSDAGLRMTLEYDIIPSLESDFSAVSETYFLPETQEYFSNAEAAIAAEINALPEQRGRDVIAGMLQIEGGIFFTNYNSMRDVPGFEATNASINTQGAFNAVDSQIAISGFDVSNGTFASYIIPHLMHEGIHYFAESMSLPLGFSLNDAMNRIDINTPIGQEINDRLTSKENNRLAYNTESQLREEVLPVVAELLAKYDEQEVRAAIGNVLVDVTLYMIEPYLSANAAVATRLRANDAAIITTDQFYTYDAAHAQPFPTVVEGADPAALGDYYAADTARFGNRAPTDASLAAVNQLFGADSASSVIIYDGQGDGVVTQYSVELVADGLLISLLDSEGNPVDGVVPPYIEVAARDGMMAMALGDPSGQTINTAMQQGTIVRLATNAEGMQAAANEVEGRYTDLTSQAVNPDTVVLGGFAGSEDIGLLIDVDNSNLPFSEYATTVSEEFLHQILTESAEVTNTVNVGLDLVNARHTDLILTGVFSEYFFGTGVDAEGNVVNAPAYQNDAVHSAFADYLARPEVQYGFQQATGMTEAEITALIASADSPAEAYQTLMTDVYNAGQAEGRYTQFATPEAFMQAALQHADASLRQQIYGGDNVALHSTRNIEAQIAVMQLDAMGEGMGSILAPGSSNIVHYNNHLAVFAEAIYTTSGPHADGQNVHQWYAENRNTVQVLFDAQGLHNGPMPFHDIAHTDFVAGRSFMLMSDANRMGMETFLANDARATALLEALQSEGLINQFEGLDEFRRDMQEGGPELWSSLRTEAAEGYIAGRMHDYIQQSQRFPTQLFEEAGIIARPDGEFDSRTQSKFTIDADVLNTIMAQDDPWNVFDTMLSGNVEQIETLVVDLRLDLDVEGLANLPEPLRLELQAAVNQQRALGGDGATSLFTSLQQLADPENAGAIYAFETWTHTANDIVLDQLNVSAESRIAISASIEATRPFTGADSPGAILTQIIAQYDRVNANDPSWMNSAERLELVATQDAIKGNLTDFINRDLADLGYSDAHRQIMLDAVENNGYLSPTLLLAFSPDDLNRLPEGAFRHYMEAMAIPTDDTGLPMLSDSDMPLVSQVYDTIDAALARGELDRINFANGDFAFFDAETVDLIFEDAQGLQRLTDAGNVLTIENVIEAYAGSADGMQYVVGPWLVESWATDSADMTIADAIARNEASTAMQFASAESSNNIVSMLQSLPPDMPFEQAMGMLGVSGNTPTEQLRDFIQWSGDNALGSASQLIDLGNNNFMLMLADGQYGDMVYTSDGPVPVAEYMQDTPQQTVSAFSTSIANGVQHPPLHLYDALAPDSNGIALVMLSNDGGQQLPAYQFNDIDGTVVYTHTSPPFAPLINEQIMTFDTVGEVARFQVPDGNTIPVWIAQGDGTFITTHMQVNDTSAFAPSTGAGRFSTAMRLADQADAAIFGSAGTLIGLREALNMYQNGDVQGAVATGLMTAAFDPRATQAASWVMNLSDEAAGVFQARAGHAMIGIGVALNSMQVYNLHQAGETEQANAMLAVTLGDAVAWKIPLVGQLSMEALRTFMRNDLGYQDIPPSLFESAVGIMRDMGYVVEEGVAFRYDDLISFTDIGIPIPTAEGGVEMHSLIMPSVQSVDAPIMPDALVVALQNAGIIREGETPSFVHALQLQQQVDMYLSTDNAGLRDDHVFNAVLEQQGITGEALNSILADYRADNLHYEGNITSYMHEVETYHQQYDVLLSELEALYERDPGMAQLMMMQAGVDSMADLLPPRLEMPVFADGNPYNFSLAYDTDPITGELTGTNAFLDANPWYVGSEGASTREVIDYFNTVLETLPANEQDIMRDAPLSQQMLFVQTHIAQDYALWNWASNGTSPDLAAPEPFGFRDNASLIRARLGMGEGLSDEEVIAAFDERFAFFDSNAVSRLGSPFAVFDSFMDQSIPYVDELRDSETIHTNIAENYAQTFGSMQGYEHLQDYITSHSQSSAGEADPVAFWQGVMQAELAAAQAILQETPLNQMSQEEYTEFAQQYGFVLSGGEDALHAFATQAQMQGTALDNDNFLPVMGQMVEADIPIAQLYSENITHFNRESIGAINMATLFQEQEYGLAISAQANLFIPPEAMDSAITANPSYLGYLDLLARDVLNPSNTQLDDIRAQDRHELHREADLFDRRETLLGEIPRALGLIGQGTASPFEAYQHALIQHYADPDNTALLAEAESLRDVWLQAAELDTTEVRTQFEQASAALMADQGNPEAQAAFQEAATLWTLVRPVDEHDIPQEFATYLQTLMAFEQDRTNVTAMYTMLEAKEDWLNAQEAIYDERGAYTYDIAQEQSSLLVEAMRGEDGSLIMDQEQRDDYIALAANPFFFSALAEQLGPHEITEFIFTLPPELRYPLLEHDGFMGALSPSSLESLTTGLVHALQPGNVYYDQINPDAHDSYATLNDLATDVHHNMAYLREQGLGGSGEAPYNIVYAASERGVNAMEATGQQLIFMQELLADGLDQSEIAFIQSTPSLGAIARDLGLMDAQGTFITGPVYYANELDLILATPELRSALLESDTNHIFFDEDGTPRANPGHNADGIVISGYEGYVESGWSGLAQSTPELATTSAALGLIDDNYMIDLSYDPVARASTVLEGYTDMWDDRVAYVTEQTASVAETRFALMLSDNRVSDAEMALIQGSPELTRLAQACGLVSMSEHSANLHASVATVYMEIAQESIDDIVAYRNAQTAGQNPDYYDGFGVSDMISDALMTYEYGDYYDEFRIFSSIAVELEAETVRNDAGEIITIGAYEFLSTLPAEDHLALTTFVPEGLDSPPFILSLSDESVQAVFDGYVQMLDTNPNLGFALQGRGQGAGRNASFVIDESFQHILNVMEERGMSVEYDGRDMRAEHLASLEENAENLGTEVNALIEQYAITDASPIADDALFEAYHLSMAAAEANPNDMQLRADALQATIRLYEQVQQEILTQFSGDTAEVGYPNFSEEIGSSEVLEILGAVRDVIRYDPSAQPEVEVPITEQVQGNGVDRGGI